MTYDSDRRRLDDGVRCPLVVKSRRAARPLADSARSRLATNVVITPPRNIIRAPRNYTFGRLRSSGRCEWRGVRVCGRPAGGERQMNRAQWGMNADRWRRLVGVVPPT